MKEQPHTVVLAYSGGLDTSVLLKQFVLAGVRVIAMTLDLGESDAVAGGLAAAELEAVRRKALDMGATVAVLADVRERFIAEHAMLALHANALYEGLYPLSSALSRPLIAALLVETARRYGADAVAHGCTGKGNDQVRIELAVRSLNPNLICLAPLRDKPTSRPEAMEFAEKHGVPVNSTVERPYSVDANLWGRSIEAGVLEDPWRAPPEDAYAWTASPADRPSEPEEIVISFHEGAPAFEGNTGIELLAALNAVAGRHGIGRLDMVEDRVVGVKSREIYECPGSITLITAHKALERLVLSRDELRFKAMLDQRYGELIYDGLWPSGLRTALDAFNASFFPRMSGEVRLALHHGTATVTGSRSPFSLYNEKLATYGREDAFRHDAAEGFIRIWGLPLEVSARVAHHNTLR
jgi:argininosuccinate synthase